jgi:signal transduction histidine kinase
MLLFLLVALVPLGIVGAFSIRTAEQLITSMVSSHLENVADDKAALLERWISERKADLGVIAGSSILRSMNPGLVARYLRLVEEKYKVYKGFAVLSHSGEVVFSSFGEQLDYEQEQWYKQSMEGRSYISNITLDPKKKESNFRISAPIVGDDGTIEGVACATVGTHTILSIILKVSLGETGECYLVDKGGTFLAHKDPKRILTDNISQSESFKNIFGVGRHRRIYTDYRGIEVLGASRKLADLDWYLVVEQDRDEAFRAADRLERYVYIVIVFSTLGAVVLAWLLSFYVVNPIRALSEAADTLARGEFENALAKTKRTDEIGMLHNAFEEMARQLQARQHSLEEKVDLTEVELRETDVKLQKTVLAAARSEQLAALGRLAAGVTHEIRTPIASLKLFLESVKAEIEISPEYEEDFYIAMNQIKRIEATINRFLDFAKPQDPIFSLVDVGLLIEEALLVVRPKANQQETVVTVSINNDLSEVEGDKKQLGEVMVNLMVNGLEAMASRGELDISACMDQFEVAGRFRRCVRIDVSDTGPGIDAENLSRLFDPFFTTKASGTGLGLSIVQSTVGRHGGGINVESNIGKGTTFSVFLPAFAEQGNEAYGENIDS